jgi:hypothetical protein
VTDYLFETNLKETKTQTNPFHINPELKGWPDSGDFWRTAGLRPQLLTGLVILARHGDFLVSTVGRE